MLNKDKAFPKIIPR